MNLAIHSKAGTAVVRKALLGATMLTLLTATAARADVPKFGFSTENSDAFRAVQQQLPVSLWSPFVGWKGANELNVVLNQARAYHVQPMITWESWDARRRSPGKPAKPARGWSDAAIANGSQDAYVRRQARYVKQYRQVVYIRFDHEMNGNRWYPWNGPSAAYRRMWIHVWGIFHRLHVTNVRWVWSPNPNSYESDDVFDRRVASFYPGSRYVDIVGMTVTRVLTQGGTLILNDPSNGYYRGPAWFLQRFDRLRSYHKPLWITEALVDKQEMQAWMPAFRQELDARPWIKAVNWLSTSAASTPSFGDMSWNLADQPFAQAYLTFRAGYVPPQAADAGAVR